MTRGQRLAPLTPAARRAHEATLKAAQEAWGKEQPAFQSTLLFLETGIKRLRHAEASGDCWICQVKYLLARIRELEAALGSSPDDTPCTCGTDDPTSARYQHEHLPWCAKGRP